MKEEKRGQERKKKRERKREEKTLQSKTLQAEYLKCMMWLNTFRKELRVFQRGLVFFFKKKGVRVRQCDGYLSLGRAVQARLWDVPAEIC